MEELLSRFESVLPELFIRLYEDFEEDYVAEYEFISESREKVRAITRSEAFDEDFYLFFKNPVGSLYGFWILDPEDFSKNPIIQLSRDGEFGVLAPNFDQFLSQLYLLGADAFQLSRYLSKVDFRKFMGDLSPLTKEDVREHHPRIILSQEAIEEQIEAVMENFGGAETLKWLKRRGVSPVLAEDLFDVVLDNYFASDNLVEFMEGKGWSVGD